MTQSKSINGITLRLEIGDITDLEIEAFVFYARGDLELGAGFGNAIAMRGGMAIKKELNAIGKLEPCQAVVTKAGGLKAEYIIHANGPKFQESNLANKLKQTMINTLSVADEKQIKQLAFPAMGAGFYGISPTECARVMYDTIQEYIMQNNSGIKEIIICLLDNRQYKPFEAQYQALNQRTSS